MEACDVKGGQGSCKSIPQIPVGKLAHQNCNRDQLSPRSLSFLTYWHIRASVPPVRIQPWPTKNPSYLWQKLRSRLPSKSRNRLREPWRIISLGFRTPCQRLRGATLI